MNLFSHLSLATMVSGSLFFVGQNFAYAGTFYAKLMCNNNSESPTVYVYNQLNSYRTYRVSCTNQYMQTGSTVNVMPYTWSTPVQIFRGNITCSVTDLADPQNPGILSANCECNHIYI